MKKKDITLSVLIALTAPNIASAESFSGIAELNLGDIKPSSFLDEPFRGSIPILFTSAVEASQLQVGLASHAIFKEFDVEEQPILNKLKFKIKVRNGQPYVDIRSTQAIDLPFLSFVIEIFSPEGSIYQDYTVLLDPRGYATNNSSAANRITTVKRNLSSTIVNQRPTRVKVNSGDTLSSIAETVKLSGVSNRKMSQAIFLNNPRAFSGNNPNKLKKGHTLKIPSYSDINNVQKTKLKIDAKKASAAANKTSKVESQATNETNTVETTTSYLVKSGDTLSGIARKFKPATESFSDFMKAIHTQNPHAFTNNKVNLLQKGATLTIPTFDDTKAKVDKPVSKVKSKSEVQPKTEAKSKSQQAKPSVSITEQANGSEFNAEHYKVINGDTLGSIVSKLEYKDIPSSKVMEAIFSANPEAFEKDNITVIKAGAIIRIPSAKDIKSNTQVASNEVPKAVKETQKTSVEQTINHSLDKLEKRLREIRTELKTTQAQLFDLNLTLKNKDILIERQSKDIRILKEKLAQVETAKPAVAVKPKETEEVSFSTLAGLITNDIKREKTLATNITYSGVAILLGLIALRIGRQRYADHIVQSEDYVPISNFDPQIVNQSIDFKKTLTDSEVNSTEISQNSLEESERLVDELVDELNHTVEEMQEKNQHVEPAINISEIQPTEETDASQEQVEEMHFEELKVDKVNDETETVDNQAIEETKSAIIEPDFELIQTPFTKEPSESDNTEEAIADLKEELLDELDGKVEPMLNFTHRAQYQSHYGLDETEIDLERRLQTINDEISVKKLEDKV